MKKRLPILGVGIALGVAIVAAAAAPAEATTAPSCAGKSSGLCLYRDAVNSSGVFNGPWAWFASGTNINWLDNYTYYSTTISVNDSVSAAKNLSNCVVTLYNNIGYTGSSIVFQANTQLGNFSSSNDQISSFYWNC